MAASIEAVYLVEASPSLREAQRKLLCGDAPMEETSIGHRCISKYASVPIVWTENLRFVPSGKFPTPNEHHSLTGIKIATKLHLLSLMNSSMPYQSMLSSPSHPRTRLKKLSKHQQESINLPLKPSKAGKRKDHSGERWSFPLHHPTQHTPHLARPNLSNPPTHRPNSNSLSPKPPHLTVSTSLKYRPVIEPSNPHQIL